MYVREITLLALGSLVQEIETFGAAVSDPKNVEPPFAAYENITPYLGYCLKNACAEIIREINWLKEWSFNLYKLQEIIHKIGSILTVASQALIHGPNILRTQPTILEDYYYASSPEAQERARPTFDKITSFGARFKEIFQYIQKIVDYSQEQIDDWKKLLLDIEFNQYKEKHLKLAYHLSQKDAGEFTEALKRNRYIQSISIYEMQFPVLWVECIANCSHIKELKIFWSECSTDATSIITRHQHLESLELGNSHINGLDLILLAQLKSLISLTLKSNSLADADIQQAVIYLQRSSIKQLILECNRITKQGLSTLARLENISELTVESDEIDDDARKCFAENTTLTILNLYGSRMKCSGLQYFAETSALNHPNRKYIKEYLLSRYDGVFVNEICKPTYFNLVIHDEELIEKLNSMQADPNRQTFAQSCSARALMLLLNKMGYLADSDFTRKKELEIYAQIWIKPDDIADFSMIAKYLSANEVKHIVHIDKNRLSRWSDCLESEIQQYETKKLNLGVQESNFNIFSIPMTRNAYFMLFIIYCNSMQHALHTVVFCHENNKYYFMDPAVGKNEEKENIEEILQILKNSYIGVAIEFMSPANPILNAQRNGFFTFKSRGESVQAEGRNQCCIQ